MSHYCYKCHSQLDVKEPVTALITVICPNPTCKAENKIGPFYDYIAPPQQNSKERNI